MEQKYRLNSVFAYLTVIRLTLVVSKFNNGPCFLYIYLKIIYRFPSKNALRVERDRFNFKFVKS
jgi:hypothetical protein